MFGLGKKKDSKQLNSSNNIEMIELTIGKMHCQSCAINIDMVLEELPGVSEANTNYAKSITQVKYDPTKVKHEAFISTIAEAGYSAKMK